MKRAITNDLQDCLWEAGGEANDAAAKSDIGRVVAVTKKLKSRHDRPHTVIRDENGYYLWMKKRSPPGGGVTGRIFCTDRRPSGRI